MQPHTENDWRNEQMKSRNRRAMRLLLLLLHRKITSSINQELFEIVNPSVRDESFLHFNVKSFMSHESCATAAIKHWIVFRFIEDFSSADRQNAKHWNRLDLISSSLFLSVSIRTPTIWFAYLFYFVISLCFSEVRIHVRFSFHHVSAFFFHSNQIIFLFLNDLHESLKWLEVHKYCIQDHRKCNK